MTSRKNHCEYPSFACTCLGKPIYHLYFTLTVKTMASKLIEPLEIKLNKTVKINWPASQHLPRLRQALPMKPCHPPRPLPPSSAIGLL